MLRRSLLSATLAVAGMFAISTAEAQEQRNGYTGAPRTELWSPVQLQYSDTSKYQKEGPYVIGFSNASVDNTWRLAQLHAIQAAAAKHKDKIKQLIITDANNNPSKQVSDVEDLLQRGVDILLISASKADALDPIVTQAMNDGVPVIMVDRRVTSENFVSFVTASDEVTGRLFAQWLVEKLNGKGNVIMLPGQAGASPAELRIAAAKSIFAQYPGIKILDLQYTDWSPAKAKSIVSAMIQKFGKDINGIWNDSGVQGGGSLEAFVAAGYKPGEIPPVTCADLNGCLKIALENKVPVLNFDYPPAMGGAAVELALQVLSGAAVPKLYFVNSDVVVSKGDETASIKADRWAEDYVRMDKPNDLILSSGLGPDYDPQTFSADYPK
ncbi:substrate-binding domain-containing protein [Taklimakanibacter deserti]|uniref:substrate-binding domain-containing protein n=1 Tax=Taklimakanibacter deserti TaxID=2267839 RepID=UPI0013C45789